MQEFDILTAPLTGINLIEANAGTGKTYTICSIYLRLIVEMGYRASEILVVTFTKAATEELRDRIRRKLKEALEIIQGGEGDDPALIQILRRYPEPNQAADRLRTALQDFDEASVFTIHSFCQRVLNENAFESGSPFDLELVEDQSDLVADIVADFWHKHFYESTALFFNFARARGFMPGALLRTAAISYELPYLKITPPPQTVETGPLETDFLLKFQQAKKLWDASKDEAGAILVNDDGLNRIKYNAKGVPQWLLRMDVFLHWIPSPGLFQQFRKFTSSEIKNSLKKGFAPPHHPFFDLCQELSETADKLTAAFQQKLIALHHELFAAVRGELPELKHKRGVQHYTDMLLGLYDALRKKTADKLVAAIRHKYKAALIDEFQDTDPIQYFIFKMLFGHRKSLLYLVGDPKQAIYKFRGADVFAYISASQHTESRFTLRRNWRSTPPLIDAVNAVFSEVFRPFALEEISFLPTIAATDKPENVLTIDGKSQPPLRLWFVDSRQLNPLYVNRQGTINKGDGTFMVASAIAAEISRLLGLAGQGKATLGQKKLQPGDIAVLTRSNREAFIVRDALVDLDIPCVLYTTENLFSSDEAVELLRVLVAVNDPRDERLTKAALTTGMLGVTGDELNRISEDEAAWENWMLKFRKYQELWYRHGFFSMLRNLIDEEDVRLRLVGRRNGERRLTNLLHLADILNQEVAENKLGPGGIIKWLAERIASENMYLEEYQLRLESDDNAVRIVTTHRSKGLEYPVVFCPFTWGDSRLRKSDATVFHDVNDGYRPVLDLDPDSPGVALAERENLAENLRLLYVALTRAKSASCAVWGKFNGAETSAMAYLLLNPALSGRQGASDNLVADTAASFKALGEEEIHEWMETIQKRSEGGAMVEKLPAARAQQYLPPIAARAELKVRQFRGKLDRSWRVASFSSLISGSTKLAESPDRDTMEITAAMEPVTFDPHNIFALPGGVRTGTLLHEVFERLDFSSPPCCRDKIVAGCLDAHNFDIKWKPAICDMLENVLSVRLDSPAGSVSLSEIRSGQRLNELEFYFPLKPLDNPRLASMFSFSGLGRHESAPTAIEKLVISPVKGFMKGFVDMVFLHDGRYYLLDWKSNYLGDRTEDYAAANLAQVMSSRYYVLQYHIYTVALDKYLSMRQPGYDYGKHFGGIYYIFVRGVNSSMGNQYGVYFDLPPEDLVRSLSENLIG